MNEFEKTKNNYNLIKKIPLAEIALLSG